MKKNIIKICIIAFSFVAVNSCADLDLPSDGRLTLPEIFNSYHRTRNYYNSCKGYFPHQGFLYGGPTILASFSDEAHDASDGIAGSVYNWYNNQTSSTSNPVENSYSWAHYFQGIRKCNTFLTSMQDPNLATAVIDEVERNGWIAEIHVLRAYLYLQLIKRWGGVPILDTPYEITHDFSKDRRATFEECVDFIIADCDAALAIPEAGTTGANIGFRWYISDDETTVLTRAFAYAVKSQAALYAASPLWYTPDSKYTWARVTDITKEALDQCLAHGFELFKLEPAADIAQNAYAYYFIRNSDASRSVDKETIYQSASRTSVWQNAGTPITEGSIKAGAGPSQELVDAYGMQATGEMPVLGYSDPQHLQPIVNTSSGYDPSNPYEGRDPRFYASIYYNNSTRIFPTDDAKDIYSLRFTNFYNNVSWSVSGNETTIATTGGNPFIHTDKLPGKLNSTKKGKLTFEYKSNKTINDAEFFFGVATAGVQEGVSTGANLVFEETSEWKKFEHDISYAITQWGFGISGAAGREPTRQFLQFNVTKEGGGGYVITIRNLQIECPIPSLPVETFVGGNCEISSDITQTKNTRTGYYLRKFNNNKSNINFNSEGYMKIFRLGELYLNFAEAASNAVGHDVAVEGKASGAGALSARQAVNTVRARAKMPPIPAGISNEEFQIRYRNERQVELAFEEHRFYDVRRWKILNETDKFVTGMRITKEGDEYIYTRVKLKDRDTNTNKYLMFPLNLYEVNKMENFTGENWQNPGW